MAISILGVVFAAGMQFLLAWYLWVNLPPVYPLVTSNGNVLKPYPGASQSDENGTYVAGRGYFQAENGFCFAPDCLTAPLPAYQYPDYSAANDVCRTQSMVQIICIGLFLFSVLTNVPGIIKNTLIILWSERFLSQNGEEDFTKIHYWRESDFSREIQDDFLDQRHWQSQPPDSSVSSPVLSSAGELGNGGGSTLMRTQCAFFRTVEYKDPTENKSARPIYLRSTMLHHFYLPLSYFGKPGIVKRVKSGTSSHSEANPEQKNNGHPLKGLPRGFFEIADARQFLSEILQVLLHCRLRQQ